MSEAVDIDTMLPTLEEVADHAGVSRATVSRVVNKSPRVSAHTREAVERSITKLGYVPNFAARSLVTKRTDTIALVISESDTRVFSDPFFATMVRGISTELATTRYMCLLATAPRAGRQVAQYVQGGHTDGVILMSLHGDDPLLAMFETSRMPAVLSGRPMGPHRIPYVDCDNVGGGRLAVEYLLAQGRRRPVVITGPLEMCAGLDRLTGFREGMPASMRRSWKRYCAVGDFTEDSGEATMRDLLVRVPDLDAVFVGNDLMAAGALRVLKASGRRVPDDVALIGFDDSVTTRHTDPQLTSVRQPVEELGRRLARLLVERIEGNVHPGSVILPTELVLRDST